jgi:hypothetical protein
MEEVILCWIGEKKERVNAEGAIPLRKSIVAITRERKVKISGIASFR